MLTGMAPRSWVQERYSIVIILLYVLNSRVILLKSCQTVQNRPCVQGVFFFEGGTFWRVNGGYSLFLCVAYSGDPPKKDNLVDNLRDIQYTLSTVLI
jgi:hypothetical protein